ncbi:MAG: hypothetical protein OEZ02_11815, partial [Anaerolineae bacterium]|nr:hypothetical protein [Anaerolineae bacterium]
MMFASKKGLKQVMGNLPLTAELDWFIRRRGQAVRGFSLEELDAVLADWQAQAAGSPYLGRDGKKVFIFAELRYWIGHAALLGLGLAGLGHEVTLGFLPYGDWRKPVADFDLRQHNLYGRKVLSQAKPMLDVISLLDMPAADDLPAKLSEAVEAVSVRDVQYTEQVEEIDRQGELFKMRWERNQRAAAVMLRWLQENQPDVIILPNGLILEFGAIYETAQHLDIPAVTYEFGEQRERIWFSQQSPVMLQDSDALWQGRQAQPFSEAQLAQVQELFAARQGATLWQNFSRQWQEAPSEGSAQVRAKLGLGGRPVVLLAANVIGDSLTLGRQIFSGSMTEWLKRTLAYFAARP